MPCITFRVLSSFINEALSITIKVEEISTMDNFDEFMSVTEPAMRTGSYITGNLIGWGTATEGNMQTFEQNFYSPSSYTP